MFDPLYIVLQIVCLQCLFYLGMGTIWELVHTFTKVPVSLDHFFSTNYINFVSYSGWIEILSMLLAGIFGFVFYLHYMSVLLSGILNNALINSVLLYSAWLLSFIVERAKKCVDFTFTLYFIHVLSCAFYQVWSKFFTHRIIFDVHRSAEPVS
jgi:hypothetical protein